MSGLVGRKLGRYEISAFVGRGGMGDVYRARDTELGRDVAVKVLSDETAHDEARLERFRREARAVAQLSHPNILDIHDFGTEEGVCFSISELLEGSDLRERLTGHPLPLSKVLKIGHAVAAGLAAAHGKGIVHRDIKPANIFLTKSGQVKILDFGIARLRQPISAEPTETDETPIPSLTEVGQVIGTTAYMSPEQAVGKPTDARSDIFSLGCVLYEMVTGQQAFAGRTANETIVAIASKDPEPISELRSDLPLGLELLIQRCLEKEPGERFESARDVAFALLAMAQQPTVDPAVGASTRMRLPRTAFKVAVAVAALLLAMVVGARLTDLWPSGPTALPSEKRLAIMPFTVEGDDVEVAQFAAGLREIIAENLDRLFQTAPNGWWVVPTSRERTNPAADIRQMYRRYGANVVLAGDVERRGPTLSIDLKSVAPETDDILRSDKIDADLGNVSSLQIDPVVRAADLVGLEVTAENRELLRARSTSVARAFELYVRARGVMAIASDDRDVEPAIAMLDEAVELDPLFAPAREALAKALAVTFEATGDRNVFDRALAELQGLAAGRSSEHTYRILANLFTSNGDHEEAVTALDRAVAMAPESGEAYQELGFALQRAGRVADAENAFQRSINIRPGYLVGPDSLGRLYMGDGRYDAAANCFRQVVACAPLNKIGYNLLGAIQYLQDDLEAALTTFQRSIEADPADNYFAYANLGTLNFNAARFADAIFAYEQALAVSDENYLVWGNLAFSYAFGAEPEKAREPFDRAIELAERARESDPENSELLADLAGFYAMVDEPEESRTLLEMVIASEPRDPQVFTTVGETFEDLNDREAALEWIGRALDGGIPPAFFESRLMLRDLIADPRYRMLVERHTASPN